MPEKVVGGDVAAAERGESDVATAVKRVLAATEGEAWRTLDGIQQEVNEDGGPHVAQGPIEAALAQLVAEEFAETMSGDGGTKVFRQVRADAAPVDLAVMAQRTGLLALIGRSGLSFGGTDLGWFNAPELATELAEERHKQTLPAEMLAAFDTLEWEDPAAVDAAIEQHLDALAEVGVVERRAGDAEPAEEDEEQAPAVGAPQYTMLETYRLAFARGGVEAVMALAYPGSTTPEQDIARIADLAQRVEHQQSLLDLARTTADVERKARLADQALLAKYEGWFSDNGVRDPRAVVEAKRDRPKDRPTAKWQVEREMTAEEHGRILKEWSAAKRKLAEAIEADAATKAASKLRVEKAKTLKNRLEALVERGIGGTIIIEKEVYKEVVNGQLVVRSADEHDYGEFLGNEPLAAGTQIVVPGSGGPAPSWTPEASAATVQKTVADGAHALAAKLAEKGTASVTVTNGANGVPTLTVTDEPPKDLSANPVSLTDAQHAAAGQFLLDEVAPKGTMWTPISTLLSKLGQHLGLAHVASEAIRAPLDRLLASAVLEHDGKEDLGGAVRLRVAAAPRRAKGTPPTRLTVAEVQHTMLEMFGDEEFAGCGIQEPDVAQRYFEWIGVTTPSDALGKLVTQATERLRVSGDLSAGEGGTATLLWRGDKPDPRNEPKAAAAVPAAPVRKRRGRASAQVDPPPIGGATGKDAPGA